MMISDSLISTMGFATFGPELSLTAQFSRVQVYALQGLVIQQAISFPITIKGVECSLGLSKTLNEVANKLIGEDYIADQAAWEKENGCQGPYLMILMRSGEVYTASEGHIQYPDDATILTYDCFKDAKQQLLIMSQEVSSEALTALACSLKLPEEHLAFKLVDEAVFGKTPDGKTLHDLKLNLTATGHQSSSLTLDSALKRLEVAAALSQKLNSKAARFFALALLETDGLKRFLYFFLAIEVQTHRSYKQAAAASVRDSTSGAADPTVSAPITLRDRFTFCTSTVWTAVGDPEIAEFRAAKTTRDAIAHGDLDIPGNHDVVRVEKLAKKILIAAANIGSVPV